MKQPEPMNQESLERVAAFLQEMTCLFSKFHIAAQNKQTRAFINRLADTASDLLREVIPALEKDALLRVLTQMEADREVVVGEIAKHTN